MAARLTRAKKRLRTIGAAFAVPDPQRWPQRCDDVARAIYLAFTAGYAPRDGPEVVHVRATSEAVRLADLAADLMTDSPVLAALSALLTLHDARRDARTGADGALVRLADQDRTRWNHSQIRAGLARLTALTPTTGYAEELRLQALIAAFHASAATSADTDWVAIARTYARLEELTGSPVVRLNRAVAVAEVAGAMAGLDVLRSRHGPGHLARAAVEGLLCGLADAVDALVGQGAAVSRVLLVGGGPQEQALRAAADQLPGHHRVAAVRAELLRREGDRQGARAAYDEALTACPDGPERRHLQARRDSLETPGAGTR